MMGKTFTIPLITLAVFLYLLDLIFLQAATSGDYQTSIFDTWRTNNPTFGAYDAAGIFAKARISAKIFQTQLKTKWFSILMAFLALYAAKRWLPGFSVRLGPVRIALR